MFLDNFLTWFLDFITTMFVDGIWRIISNFFGGIVTIFNFPAYFNLFRTFGDKFSVIEWILAVLAFILTFAIWAGLIFMLILLIRKYLRFRSTLVGNEDLLEEIADLHRDVLRLTREKEKILALKAGASLDELRYAMDEGDREADEQFVKSGEGVSGEEGDEQAQTAANGVRFFRLNAVDEKYNFYAPPTYENPVSLEALCDDLRNFACYKARLFYEIKTIRLMFSGLAATKMILLQGISGTGKTSLPYIMGKYFLNDTTIASVQPSWRDRTELFGYFNEFTKKFNETEVLRRIYESGFNDDINIIVLDEMNIARVEYYFAEMLSVLEMPDPNEWKIELVPSSWPNDPKHLQNGTLVIPQNVWYIGTANNDDSTFAVSDKVYDRAQVINLDTKGIEFKPEPTTAKKISYTYVAALYDKACEDHPVSQETLDKIAELDLYVIEHFRVAFGNRIMKQLKRFVPVYIACGGTEVEGLDYVLATKVFRKFEGLNLSLIRDEIKGLIQMLDNLFGKDSMKECIAYLRRLQKMY